MPLDARVEAAARGRIDDRIRAARVAAAAAFAAWRVLVDGHLSRNEERTLRRVLREDFEEDELEVIVELLRAHGPALAATRPSEWAHTLGPWLLRERIAQENEYETFVAQSLAVRWPLPIDGGARTRWDAEDLDWDREHLKIGGEHGMHSMTIPWRHVESLEPVDPWPQLLLEWKDLAGVAHARLTPRGDAAAFADRVSDLIDEAKRRVPTADDRVRAGWLAHPDASWEPVEHWPGEAPLPQASYRTAPQKPEEVLAHRPARGGLHTLLAWLASGPERPWRTEIVEAKLTARHLYVRRRRGGLERVPVATLRARRGDTDAIYVFGRRTEALLAGRAGCPVCQRLDARLAG